MDHLEKIYIKIISPEMKEECRNVILPVIYEKLEENTFDGITYGKKYIAFAAEADQVYVGASVMELGDFGAIELVSMFVLSAFRKRGIASSLLSRSLSTASSIFVWPEKEDIIYEMERKLYEIRQMAEENGNDMNIIQQIDTEETDLRETCDEILFYLSKGEYVSYFTTEYCLPPGMFSIWESFLKANGFTEFQRMSDKTIEGKLYYYGEAACDVIWEKGKSNATV